MELAPGQIVDRYAVEGPIGQGGMASVWLVRHLQLGSLHALKVLHLPSRAIRQRLLQEGRVQATLRHPNVVAVTDVVFVGDAPGLVMEYIAGPSLERLLMHQRVTAAQADALARGIIAGVGAAHRRGLVHRDLKPANVLLEITEGGIVPKVSDFGLAKLTTESGSATQTRSGMTMGTPAYMAPEQIRDAKNVDARADVFALGCVLYELACGCRAFRGEDTLALFQSIAEGRYRPPRELVPELPERIEAAIAGALEVDRDRRIADCDELLAVWMGRSQRGTPVHGTPWSASLLVEAASLGTSDAPAPLPAAVAESAPTWGEAVPFDTKTLGWYQAPSPPTTTRSLAPALWIGLPVVVLASGGLLAALAVGAAGAALWFGNREPAPPADVARVEVAPVEVAPVEAPPVEVAPTEAPPVAEVAAPTPADGALAAPSRPSGGTRVEVRPPRAEPPPPPERVANPEPPPAPEAPAIAAPVVEAPEGPPPGKGRVIAEGDGRVWLVADIGRFRPGDLPPATYQVMVFFGREPEGVDNGTVTVRAGETVTLRCLASLKRCSAS